VTLRVRPLADADREWLAMLLDTEWGGPEQVLEHETYRPLEQDVLIAEAGSARVGVVAFERRGTETVVGLIHALEPRRGVGTALMDGVIGSARERGSVTVRVVTTNDNVAAQRLYEIRRGAIDRARLRKPTIPRTSADGTPITDELEYVLELGRATGSPSAG
jgi:GNAT superfamily N-acetyltransferase